ncbi:MAG: M42 family metallopeptidase [Clostridia bacterium]|nr:M42 family metallopeptidase [Clostridia bacterium]
MANKIIFDEKYCLEVFKKLVACDSTTGKCEDIEKLVADMLDQLGYPYQRIHKGGIIADLGGEGNPLVVTGHLDDIGLMVRHINADGTLKVVSVGGLYAFYCVTENVRIYTRDGQIYTGTICRTPNSIHVTEDELRKNIADFEKNTCIVLDEDVKCAEDVARLGIETGDFIALEPRFTVSNGYIKSRFVDDKGAVALMFAALKQFKENKIALPRKVYFYFAEFEEIGHGTTVLPDGVSDILAIDIAPTGPEQTSDEKKVSIFAKDSRYPYHNEMTNELRQTAIDNNIDYVMDVFTPHYGTDCDGSIAAGYDVRHAAIGFGTANSHGYERTHVEGLKQTFNLLTAFLLK